jgi:hypothetical protein
LTASGQIKTFQIACPAEVGMIRVRQTRKNAAADDSLARLCFDVSGM